MGIPKTLISGMYYSVAFLPKIGGLKYMEKRYSKREINSLVKLIFSTCEILWLVYVGYYFEPNMSILIRRAIENPTESVIDILQ